MEKSKAEIEKMILDFLKEHGENYFTCALATCWENQPRNTPVDARNDGLNMYFSADPGGKLENIRRNPDVCLAVFIPIGKGDMKKARGLQMWGKAHLITLAENPEAFEKGFGIVKIDEIFKLTSNMPFPEAAKPKITIVKIVPEKISYFVFTEGKPVKYIWKVGGSS